MRDFIRAKIDLRREKVHVELLKMAQERKDILEFRRLKYNALHDKIEIGAPERMAERTKSRRISGLPA